MVPPLLCLALRNKTRPVISAQFCVSEASRPCPTHVLFACKQPHTLCATVLLRSSSGICHLLTRGLHTGGRLLWLVKWGKADCEDIQQRLSRLLHANRWRSANHRGPEVQETSFPCFRQPPGRLKGNKLLNQ